MRTRQLTAADDLLLVHRIRAGSVIIHDLSGCVRHDLSADTLFGPLHLQRVLMTLVRAGAMLSVLVDR